MSRRGALALVGGSALGVAVLTAGQTIGGIARQTVLFLPRGRSRTNGPNDFPINKTAAAAGIDPAAIGAAWRLTLTGGPTPVVLDRAALAAMPQHTERLPIGCVQGWSTVQTWSGVRLADLAAAAGVPVPLSARVQSLQKVADERIGDYSRVVLQANQVLNPRCAVGAARERRRPVARIMATRPGSSCRRCPVCTTPNGSVRLNSKVTDVSSPGSDYASSTVRTHCTC